MKCAIMQPTYLPWAGYFSLIDSVDHFVFLEDVQFEKQSWQSRNRLCQNGNDLMLSIPIKKTPSSSLISQIEVSDHIAWQNKHIATIKQSYARSPYVDEILDVLLPLLRNKNALLVDYTIPIIKAFSSALNIEVQWHTSKDIPNQGSRSLKLVEVCKFLTCRTYISPKGSQGYIQSDGDFTGSGIVVEYQDYIPRRYQQRKSSDFLSHLSIVDVIANIGLEETQYYIRSKGQ